MSKLLIGREYPDAIIEEVKNAQNSIKILMYDWRWYSHQPAARIQQLNQELIQAAKRGVDVHALLNNGFVVGILKSNGINAAVSNSSKTLHIKLVLIDEKTLFIGSHNFSINGFELNHEMSLVVHDQDIISRCNNFFQTICQL